MQRLVLGGGLVVLAFAGWMSFETAHAADDATAATPKASNKVVLGPQASDLTSGIPGKGPLTLAELQIWLDDPKNHEPLDFELPLGLAAGASQIRGVDENPLTRAKIELSYCQILWMGIVG